jgi:hypothetical protein
MYNEFLKSGIEEITPEFEQPKNPPPSLCVLDDATKFEDLNKLITDTTEALTYVQWLNEQLSGACEASAAGFTDVLNDINGQLEAA